MARVLVVEDDPFLRKAYISILTKEKFDTEFAEDGIEALKKAEAQPPDLILLDMLMPNLDGMEFLRQYDAPNKHPQVKIILFSNITDNAKAEKAYELGATHCKTKAFYSPKELVKLINDTLTNHTARS